MYKLILFSLLLINLNCSSIDKKNRNDENINKEISKNNYGEKNSKESQFVKDVGLLKDSVNLDVDCVDPFVDTNDIYSFTSLGLECKRGDLQAVIAEINRGACIENCMSDEIYNYDLLYASFVFDQYDILDYVIENKLYADVNKVYDENNMTPLVMSCKIENDKLALRYANILIKNGANINVDFKYGGEHTQYPIIVAIDNNKVKIVELFLSKGVDLSIKDSEGYTVRELVEEYGTDEMKALFKKNE